MEHIFKSEVSVGVYSELVVDQFDLTGKAYEDIEINDTVINWGIGLDLKNRGVEFIMFAVPDQSITISGSYYQEEEEEDFEVTVNLKDVKVDINMSYEQYDRDSIRGLYPSELNYYNGRWTLEF